MPEPKRLLKVFLCHASQDKPIVRELYQRLNAEGWIDIWLDEKKLLPGQDWRLNIEEAVETSDIVIICLSSNSVSKEGFVQKELRYAKEISLEKLEDTIFLIPLRIDDCDVPRGVRFYQWADYFGEKRDETYNALLESLKLRYNQKLKIEKEEHDRKEQEKLEREATITQAGSELSSSLLKTQVLETTQWIYSFQRDDGSFPSDSNDVYSCTWTTSKILWGLLMSNPTTKTKPFARFLSWLKQNQNSDGGMAFIKRDDPSIVDATSAYIASLVYNIDIFGDIETKNNLNRSLEWLVNKQSNDGGWNWYPNSQEPPMISSSAFAVLALDLGQHIVKDAALAKSIEKGIEWLMNTQNKDGGWGTWADDSSKPAPTAITLWSLAEMALKNTNLKAKLDDGSNFLLKQQKPDGSWRNTIERSTGLTITRLSTPYSLIGLVLNGLSPTSPPIQKGYSSLMQTFETGKFYYEDTGIFTWPTADGLMAITTISSHIKTQQP